jgi:mannose-6-phosphate isomerase-like protein (cupin superfamily)
MQRAKSLMIGLFVIVCAAVTMNGYGADKVRPKSGAARFYHESEERGFNRPVDLSPLGKAVSSEILAGPANGLNSAFLIYTRMPAGSHGPAMYTLPVDHTYLVLAGQMNVQLGTDKFVAGPNTLVLVPANVPHEAWNAGSAPVTVFEVVTPAPATDLLSLMKPAAARKIENAARYIRVAQSIEGSTRGTNAQMLIERKTDPDLVSHIQERIDNVKVGYTVGPGLHVHPFDQIYFELEGFMTLQYGISSYRIKPNSLVIIPTGVVHVNKNEGPDFERHITLLLPEPPAEPFDLPVEFKPAPVRPARQQ